MSAVFRYGRWVALGAFAAGYAMLAHYTIVARAETLGALVALAPILLAGLSVAWNARYRAVMLCLFGLACAVLFMAWSRVEVHYDQIYWIEHVGTQLFLCFLFGRTLGKGKEPMVTYFARMVHDSLTPALEVYTRKVTIAWAVFFGLMATASVLLFFLSSLEIWSAFSNFFTGPAIGLMFVAEYIVRKRTQPHMEHAHIMDGVKAYWNTSTH